MAIKYSNNAPSAGRYGSTPITQIQYGGGIYKFVDSMPMSSVLNGAVKTGTPREDDDGDWRVSPAWGGYTSATITKTGRAQGNLVLRNSGNNSVFSPPPYGNTHLSLGLNGTSIIYFHYNNVGNSAIVAIDRIFNAGDVLSFINIGGDVRVGIQYPVIADFSQITFYPT